MGFGRTMVQQKRLMFGKEVSSSSVVRDGSTVLQRPSLVVQLVYFKEKVICLLPVSSFFNNCFCEKVQVSSLYGRNGFSRILYRDYFVWPMLMDRSSSF